MKKIEKQALNFFISQKQGCAFVLDCYHTTDFCNTLKLSEDDAIALIRNLVEQGYLHHDYLPNGLSFGVHLSYQGLHYKSHIFNKLIKSLWIYFLSPLIIAFLAAVFTILLEKLL